MPVRVAHRVRWPRAVLPAQKCVPVLSKGVWNTWPADGRALGASRTAAPRIAACRARMPVPPGLIGSLASNAHPSSSARAPPRSPAAAASQRPKPPHTHISHRFTQRMVRAGSAPKRARKSQRGFACSRTHVKKGRGLGLARTARLARKSTGLHTKPGPRPRQRGLARARRVARGLRRPAARRSAGPAGDFRPISTSSTTPAARRAPQHRPLPASPGPSDRRM